MESVTEKQQAILNVLHILEYGLIISGSDYKALDLLSLDRQGIIVTGFELENWRRVKLKTKALIGIDY